MEINCNPNTECGKGSTWMEGMLYLLGGSISLFLVGVIIYLWFSCSWDKAKEKAEEEIRTSQKK